MKAILWDGHKQINGELILQKKRLEFRLSDFGETDLDFDVSYREIREVKYHSLYKLTGVAVEIISEQGRHNIFIVDDPMNVKKAIEVRCEVLSG